jgi:hypothetical protein
MYLMFDHSEQQIVILAKVRERLAVNRQQSQRFSMERLNFKKLNEVESKEQFRVKVTNRWKLINVRQR